MSSSERASPRPPAAARPAAMIANRQTTNVSRNGGDQVLDLLPARAGVLAAEPVQTSRLARLMALSRLIHSVSVRTAPSNPSRPMMANVIQPIVC